MQQRILRKYTYLTEFKAKNLIYLYRKYSKRIGLTRIANSDCLKVQKFFICIRNLFLVIKESFFFFISVLRVGVGIIFSSSFFTMKKTKEIQKLESFPVKIRNWSQYVEGKERLKKEADHSTLVSGTCNKQVNLRTRLLSAQPQDES